MGTERFPVRKFPAGTEGVPAEADLVTGSDRESFRQGKIGSVRNREGFREGQRVFR